MDKLIRKDKGKIDKMMNTLIKKDIPRDKKLHAIEKKEHVGKASKNRKS